MIDNRLKVEDIIKKIRDELPDFETFENRIIQNVRDKYFPLVYQCLYERIIPANRNKLTSEEYKNLLKNNLLTLLNDIYRTRMPKADNGPLLKRLLDVEDFNDYKGVLRQFLKETLGQRFKISKNALSLGTKVLHTYNPEVNPILDSVIRNNLGIGELSWNLCLNFKDAMNDFADSRLCVKSAENA